MSTETIEQETTREGWEVPQHYPFSEDSNPNPRNERAWCRELTEQVRFLTVGLAAAAARIDDLELKAKRPPPKATTQPKPKAKAGGD